MRDEPETWRQVLPSQVLGAIMATSAIALWLSFLEGAPATLRALTLPWWAVAVAFYVTEAHVAHLHVGGDAHSFSLSEIALVLALFSLPPEGAVSAAIAGGAVALALHRRQRLVKFAFNLAHVALVATVASVVFTALLPSGSLSAGPATWLAALAAVVPASLLGTVLIQAAIGLTQRGIDPDRARVTRFALVAASANTSLGLAAAVMLSSQPAAGWMLVVPAAALLFAYRAILAEQQRRQGIEFLYEGSEIIIHAATVEEAVPRLLGHAGRAFRAGLAELTIFPRDASEVALRSWWWPEGGGSPLTPLPADPVEMVAACVVADSRGLLVPRGRRGAARPPALSDRPLRDAIVVAVEGDRGPIGTLMLANKLGGVSTFAAEEVRLLETLARQLGAALENGELERSLAAMQEGERRLRHEALHDPLTGVPNRSLFADRLRHALSRRTTCPVTVLFIDLDGFKAVNDSLGHSAGDSLLATIATRLSACLRPEDTAARLGGDEFAVLLEQTDFTQGLAIAERARDAIGADVPLRSGALARVGASIGVATGVPGDVDAEELLRRADAAMYRAKAFGHGAADVWEAETGTAMVGAHGGAGGNQ